MYHAGAATATPGVSDPDRPRRPVAQVPAQVGELVQRPRRESRPRPGLQARVPHPVVDRDLGDARAGGAALDEQLGAHERAAGPEVQTLHQVTPDEPERAVDVAHGQVQRGAEEAIPQCAAGTPADRALRQDPPPDDEVGRLRERQLGIALGPSRVNANATRSPPDAQIARA